MDIIESNNINYLPLDVMDLIISFILDSDILNLRRTCKNMNEIVRICVRTFRSTHQIYKESIPKLKSIFPRILSGSILNKGKCYVETVDTSISYKCKTIYTWGLTGSYTVGPRNYKLVLLCDPTFMSNKEKILLGEACVNRYISDIYVYNFPNLPKHTRRKIGYWFVDFFQDLTDKYIYNVPRISLHIRLPRDYILDKNISLHYFMIDWESSKAKVNRNLLLDTPYDRSSCVPYI
jgi:hypothetical protein